MRAVQISEHKTGVVGGGDDPLPGGERQGGGAGRDGHGLPPDSVAPALQAPVAGKADLRFVAAGLPNALPAKIFCFLTNKNKIN